MKKCKLLFFDLDGTLLQSEKTISTRTLSALKKCRENDILIGVSTSRSEQNSVIKFRLNQIKEVCISSYHFFLFILLNNYICIVSA